MKQTRKQSKSRKPYMAVRAIEERIQIIPGQPPFKIQRKVEFSNGKGRKTVRITRGNRIVSDITRKLDPSECIRIKDRTYIKGLYTPLEQETMQKLTKQ
jgi:hypothetical protein